MCAIIGWNGKITNLALRHMFRRGGSWGPHAVGLAHLKNERLHIFKRAVSFEYFLRNCNHRIETASHARVGLGHTRWKTHGLNTDENAHPFTYDGITFIHNGIIGNYRHITPDAIVDSECLGPLLRMRNTTRAIGSIGVVWFEKNELYAYRRNQKLRAYIWVDETGEPVTTTVVTHAAMLPRFSMMNNLHLQAEFPMKEGTAYRVHSWGLEPVWKDSDGSSYGHWSERETCDADYHGG